MLQYPQQIAGLCVTSVIDLTTGYDSSNPPTYKPQLPLSSGHMIQFRAERDSDGSKIVLTVRTSGTEPKIKYYLEGSGKDQNVIARLLEQVVEELGDVWMEAEKNNLSKP
ncbi:Glucose 1,6-bisphosphate synthase [Marasmius tenuissimus]|nr:Glucose 1,6-bisphosphate synthase [Marasmius tenuissimus]